MFGIKQTKRLLSKPNKQDFNQKIESKVRLEFIVGLFLVLSTLTVYWQIINHDFISFDDDKYVTENHRVKNGLNLNNFIWAFKSSQNSNWHPLTWLSHMLDVQLYGMNPGPHHMTSLLFHILNSLLLFAVFKRMTGKIWQSGFVAAMFALHPLHVESVAWVAERKDVLSTFFGMVTLWSYARYSEYPKVTRYFPVIGFFSLGLMAKPMLVTLPFILLLLDFWPLRRMQINASTLDTSDFQLRSLRQLLLEKSPLFFLSIASSFITFMVQKKGGAIGTLDTHSLFVRIANALVSYLKYFQQMFWPDNLAVLYPYPTSIYSWQVTGAIVLLSCISFFAVKYRRKLPWFVVGWFWFMGTLVPMIGLVKVGVQAMADRYTYIPLIGLFIIIAWGVPQLVDRWRHKTKLIFAILAILFPIIITTSWIQASYWQSSMTLFKHALDVTSNNYVMHNNFGYELGMQGHTDDAIKQFKKAINIYPDFEMAYTNLGKALSYQGKLDESIHFYQDVLANNPDYADVHHNLGIILLRKRELDNAIFHFREALRINTEYAETYNNLGAAMTAKGEHQEAINLFKDALRTKPDFFKAERNLN